ncbi:hypothetical protein B4U80_12538, partial [Leptotrombidium deliense]
KPRPGMYYLFQQYYNNNVKINFKIMIGDAAGRPKDYSAVDLLFAKNLNFNSFQTPNDFITKSLMPETVEHAIAIYNTKLPIFNPKSLFDVKSFIARDIVTQQRYESFELLLDALPSTYVIFVGCPASGKSTFYNKYLRENHFHEICRDKLQTMRRCEKEIQKLKNVGMTKIVVNNLNIAAADRKRYLNILADA